MPKLICEILNKLNGSPGSTNLTTRLYGACVETSHVLAQNLTIHDKAIPISSRVRSLIQGDLSRIYAQRNLSRSLDEFLGDKLSKSVVAPPEDYDDPGAAIFIIIVILFYSCSIACLIFSNIKCNFEVIRKLGVPLVKAKNDFELYDMQQEETKNTIQMIFSESSRLATSIAIPSYAESLLKPVADLESGKR